MKTKNYQEQLLEDLKIEGKAAAYLDAALEDGDPGIFLVALRNVAMAQGGIQVLAGETNLHRVNLNRMLSEKGNPELQSLSSIFRQMGFRFRVEAVVPKTWKRRVGAVKNPVARASNRKTLAVS
jgi:probable addiction module antidote protein